MKLLLKNIKRRALISIGILILALSSCLSHASNANEKQVEYFTFENDTEDWLMEFVDYPVGQEDFYELDAQWHESILQQESGSLALSSVNHSDDVFMYAKKRITGLNPESHYKFRIKFTIAVNVSGACVGIGGGTSSSITVKTGITNREPLPVTVDNFYRLNVDKGNQSKSGLEMISVGNMANSNPECIANDDYEPKVFNGLVSAVTNEKGEVWAIIGTDSGYEGHTTLYIEDVKIVAINQQWWSFPNL